MKPAPTKLTEAQAQNLQDASRLSNQGDFEAAYLLIQSLRAEKVQDPAVEFYTGFLVEKLKEDKKSSVRHFKKALALMETLGTSERDPILQALSWFYMAYSLEKLKRNEESESALSSAFAILEKLDEAGQLKDGIGYYMLAYAYDKHNQKELSVEYYRKAIAYFETNNLNYYYLRGALYNIGLYHYNNGEFSLAAQYWKSAYEKEPANGYFKNFYEQWYTIASEQAKTQE
jgi:tetratricopeptide (TPR) repeat protein